jgi:3-hydroxyisobutyrate dehydrogenase-like beta-hydroxyacid dehydrogenase
MSAARSNSPVVGWVGLGDQGGPMAQALAESEFELHVWARRPTSLSILGDRPFVAHETAADLAAAVDVLVLCVREDSDIESLLLENGIEHALREGSVLVNQGTGLPGYAQRIESRLHQRGVASLDAPVSGGRPGAEARTLVTMVGGSLAAFESARSLFETYSAHVVHVGGAGAGQLVKLFNNTLLMANQKNLQDILRAAATAGLEIRQLLDLLSYGTGSSRALQTLLTAVTPHNAAHLSELQLIDMELFDQAMHELQINTRDLSERAVIGAQDLPEAAQIVAHSRAEKPGE